MYVICAVCGSTLMKKQRLFCSLSCSAKYSRDKRRAQWNWDDKFWRRIEKTDSCWFWLPSKHRKSYGAIRLQSGENELTHRASWILHYGEIPARLCVLHSCDNPPCVRPDHLFLGTIGDNNRDSATKGRWNGNRHGSTHGENHHNAKLSDASVIAIRVSLTTGNVTQSALARQYGVSQTHILRISRYESRRLR